MNEVNEIHRDVYVGMVAEEMAQSGYYGEDVTIYGFLERSDSGFSWYLHSFSDETKAAESYLSLLQIGKVLSHLDSIHRRVPIEEKVKVVTCLDEKLMSKIKEHIVLIPKKNIDLDPMWEYLKSVKMKQREDKIMAVRRIMMLPQFEIPQGERREFLKATEVESQEYKGKRYYGFFMKKSGEWHLVSNGSLPAILHKWLECCRSVMTTPILTTSLDKRKPIYELRNEFNIKLMEIMDKEYLKMIEQMYASLKM